MCLSRGSEEERGARHYFLSIFHPEISPATFPYLASTAKDHAHFDGLRLADHLPISHDAVGGNHGDQVVLRLGH